MTLRSMKNLYRGMNAHLHSLAQNPYGSPTIWTSFHASHIGHINDALNQRLPPNYIARPEQSLQIWTEDEDGAERRQQPRPDSAIFRTGQGNGGGAASETGKNQSSTRVISIREWLSDEEITIPSVVIYKPASHEVMGEPVTRIELLSESNKRGGSGYHGYLQNRRHALYSGTSLIELDYLHQSASPLPGVPVYPYEPDSHAYLLAVTDRRPGFNAVDEMLVYVIDVDQPLPTQVLIPLSGSDALVFDFDAVYQHTFEIGRWGAHIDYRDQPRRFESYSEPDREAIRQVMTAAASGMSG